MPIVFAAAAPESQASKDRTEHMSGLEVIDHDFTATQLYSLDAAKAIEMSSPVAAKRLLNDQNLNVTGFALSPDGKQLAFSANKTPLLAYLKDEDVFLLDVSGDFLINASDSDSVSIYLYADDRTGNEMMVAHGPGLFDAAITVSNTDAVRCTGNLRASGSWVVFSSGTLT